jgi:delta1-piperideine-2-carboxylate reductase
LKRVPGDRRHHQRAKSQVNGIELDVQTLANLRELAGG